MKKVNSYKRVLGAALFILSAGMVFDSCKKADDHYQDILSRPWVSTYGYPQSVLIGDTLTLIGRLFIDKGGYIQVNNVKAVFVSAVKSVNADGGEGDEVRFVVTKEMGSGTVPVEVVANGITILLPSISIRQYTSIPLRTDTTLYVEQVTQFTPVDLADYQTNRTKLLINSSIDANGNIWFNNPRAIYKITGSTPENVIQTGSRLTDSDGSFGINLILGSVISYDGNTLTFSAAVSDNADTVNNYVFKLCQLDVATKAVTTLNRTLVNKNVAAVNGLPGAFQGAVNKLNIVAMTLHTDANNALYFNNSYLVPSTEGYPPSTWYENFLTNGNVPYGPYVIGNISKVDNAGMVEPLFSIKSNVLINNPAFTVPGFPAVITGDYKISQDGSIAYIYDNTDGFGDYSLLQYDLNKKIPLLSTGIFTAYRFLSYDTDPMSAYSGSIYIYFSFSTYGNGVYALQPLPNGTILFGVGASIAALNILDQNAYAYAGSEVGVNGTPAESQTQTTGKAKNVNFNSNDAGDMIFCGVDKNGVVYYVRSATGIDLISPPLTFYKIYSRK